MNCKLAALAAALMTTGMFVWATPAAAQIPTDGIWISRSALQALPTSGTAWTRLSQEAAKSCSTPDLSNQDDPTNVCVMAKALVAARTGHTGRRGEVVAALTQIADGSTYNGRALALGRELIAYVIAADLIELRALDPGLDQRFRSRLRVLLTTPTSGGPASLVKCHEERPNNWGTHCGGSRIAVAAYLGDQTELARAARVFKGWLGDRSSYSGFKYGDTSWQCDASRPVGINPVGCLKLGNNIDGVIADDQRRGGGFTWPAPKENYVYEALQGALAQAVILERAGYPAFEWESRALLRAFDWLHSIARYPAVSEDIWEAHVVNHFYGRSFPAATPAPPGKNVGWTDWTHPRGGYLPTLPQLPQLPPVLPEPEPTPTPVPDPPKEPTKEPTKPTPAPIPVPVPTPAPEPLPPSTDPGYVGQIKAISFEQGSLTDSLTGLDRVVGGAAIALETAAPLWGYYAARVTGESVYLEERFTASSDFYLSFYVQLLKLPAGDARIALISNGGESIGNLVLRSSGRLRLRVGSKTIGVESDALVPGRIYRIGLHQRAGNGGNAGLEAFVAEERTAFGKPFAVLSNGAWTTAADRIRLGATASAALDAVFDNAVLAAGEMPTP